MCTTTSEATKTHEIKLILCVGNYSEEYKLMSTVSGLTLYFEALDDGSAPDGALGSGNILIIPFRNNLLLKAYFEKIKVDQRTISIEEKKKS